MRRLDLDRAIPNSAEKPVRFRFGENWQSFVATVDADKIAAAEDGLRRLFPGDEIRGSRFLDIGCGSGLAALAASRLGAAAIDAIDLDAASVAATNALFAKFAPESHRSVRQASVFDLAPARLGTYDIVHSWGVLHHTGDLWAALEGACAMVGERGRLAIALYRRTPLCRFWAVEKRYYAQAGPAAQAAVRALYKGAYRAGLLATGRNPARYIARYRSARGMDWHHDVHDWLGGHPYQSTGPAAVAAFLAQRGFAVERVFAHAPVAFGLFGSHCDEYVAARRGVHATNP
jgi:2-polyprenyl-3-methyl-5-hydroxy-6-metoxy-1,4-benzoquinol methylase